MSDPGPQWRRDEEFRQSVIRKALLLGFECEEYSWNQYAHNTTKLMALEPVIRWRFKFEGQWRDSYVSTYSAAYDYLRLMKIPHEVIGDYRG